MSYSSHPQNAHVAGQTDCASGTAHSLRDVRYLSLFSGAGGLESPHHEPVLCCELDPACRIVLGRRFPEATLHDDVTTLRGSRVPRVDLVTGGWPCQDLSVAGTQQGLEGARSGLFFELLRVAQEARATTIVAENVPNLLTLDGERTFRRVLEAFAAAGFATVAWRTMNARSFGLPHQRRRVFIIASKDPSIPPRLHRRLPPIDAEPERGDAEEVAGFYTTAGLQSICFSVGYVPTLKVGSGLAIPSPPGVYFDGCVRKASDAECLRLQGFDPADFEDVASKDRYRMAGNAVAVPVGRFAMESIATEEAPAAIETGAWRIGPHGMLDEGVVTSLEETFVPEPARNLADFVDLDDRVPLSARAAAGLLTRLDRSGKPCPEELWEALLTAAGDEYSGAREPTCRRLVGADRSRDPESEPQVAAPGLALF